MTVVKYRVIDGGQVWDTTGSYNLNDNTSQAKLKRLFKKGHKGVIEVIQSVTEEDKKEGLAKKKEKNNSK